MTAPADHQKVLIVDFGSQVTQLIARRLREARVYCEIHPYSKAEAALVAMKPQAIILSGGPESVHEEGSPRAPQGVFEAGQVRAAVRDAAQADDRHAEPGGGADHGEGLHVDHVGVDGVIADAGDHAPTRGQSGRRQGGRAIGQRQDGGDPRIGRLALRKAKRAGVHVAITDLGDPIDAGVVEAARARGAERDDHVRQGVVGPQALERMGDRRGGLDRTDAGDQGADAAAQGRAVFRLGGHDAEGGLRTEAGKGPVPAHARRS